MATAIPIGELHRIVDADDAERDDGVQQRILDAEDGVSEEICVDDGDDDADDDSWNEGRNERMTIGSWQTANMTPPAGEPLQRRVIAQSGQHCICL